MATQFDYLLSEFTGLVGSDVDLTVLRNAITDNVSIPPSVLLPQPDGLHWINELPDPTLRISFDSNLAPIAETALDTEVATHSGPILGKVTTRAFARAFAPSVTDDNSSPERFIIGDSWTDTLTDRQWSLAKMTPGAAVWKRSDVGGSPSVSQSSIDAFEELINGAVHDKDQMLVTLAGGGAALLPIGEVFATALFGFFTGYNLSWISTSIVEVAAGDCTADDQSGFIFSAGALQANTAASGAGGLDTGGVAADTWYAAWIISDSTQAEPVALMLSASFSSPTMPLTYDRKRLVGSVRTNGSSNLMRFVQQGNSRDRSVWWDENRGATPQRVLAGGGASTFADVDCSDVISPISDLGYFLFQTSNAGSGIRLRPDGFQDASGTLFVSDGSAMSADLGLASQMFEYEQVGATTLTVDVRGYMERL